MKSHKEGGILTLIRRALRICSPQHLEKKLNHIRGVCVANGYSEKTYKRLLEKTRAVVNSSTATAMETTNNQMKREPKKPTLILPCDTILIGRCRGIARRFGVDIVAKPSRKLRQLLVHPKDQIEDMDKQGVVYELEFSDGKRYVGETGRCVGERLKEHKRDIRLNKSEASPVAEHVCERGAVLEKCNILANESCWSRRRTLEALWIARRGELNRDCGLEGVSEFWSACK